MQEKHLQRIYNSTATHFYVFLLFYGNLTILLQ